MESSVMSGYAACDGGRDGKLIGIGLVDISNTILIQGDIFLQQDGLSSMGGPLILQKLRIIFCTPLGIAYTRFDIYKTVVKWTTQF